MGDKRWSKEINFADVAVTESLKHNRSITMMKLINTVVTWSTIEALLTEYYEISTSREDPMPTRRCCC